MFRYALRQTRWYQNNIRVIKNQRRYKRKIVLSKLAILSSHGLWNPKFWPNLRRAGALKLPIVPAGGLDIPLADVAQSRKERSKGRQKSSRNYLGHFSLRSILRSPEVPRVIFSIFQKQKITSKKNSNISGTMIVNPKTRMLSIFPISDLPSDLTYGQ